MREVCRLIKHIGTHTDDQGEAFFVGGDGDIEKKPRAIDREKNMSSSRKFPSENKLSRDASSLNISTLLLLFWGGGCLSTSKLK